MLEILYSRIFVKKKYCRWMKSIIYNLKLILVKLRRSKNKFLKGEKRRPLNLTRFQIKNHLKNHLPSLSSRSKILSHKFQKCWHVRFSNLCQLLAKSTRQNCFFQKRVFFYTYCFEVSVGLWSTTNFDSFRCLDTQNFFVHFPSHRLSQKLLFFWRFYILSLLSMA